MDRKCIICGKFFAPRNSKHLCCCKECSNQYAKSYYHRNRDIKLRQQKEYNIKNIEKIKKYRRKKKQENIKYYTRTCIICGEIFTTTKSKKLYCSEECNKIRNRRKAQEYLNKRYKENINFKLTVLCRINFKRCMDIVQNYNKEYHTFDILGYTPKQLKQRLEFQFKKGMTWDNYGVYWEIHHKKELCKFNFGDKNNLDYNQIRLAHSLANLKPVTKEEHKLIHRN